MKPEMADADRVREIFYSANFVRDLDIRLDKFAEGICETSMVGAGANAAAAWFCPWRRDCHTG